MVKLMPHQSKVLDETLKFNRAAYYLDMGLGKTFVGSEKAVSYENQILLICQKSKIDDWVAHFEEFYPDEIISDLSSKKPDYTAGVMIINYDIVWRRDQISKLSDVTLILDESSCIKNPTSKRTKAVMKIKASNVILLSGTPTGGKYEELVTQCNLLGWKISKKEFWNRYVNYFEIDQGGFKIPIINKKDPYKRVDELKSNLRRYGAVFLKTDEVLDLPDQTDIIIPVAPTTEYKKMLKDRLCTIDDVELVGDTPTKLLLYKIQLCGTYNDNKYAALADLIESTNDRLIVFYNYTNSFERIKKICKTLKRPVSYVNGQGKDLTAYENDSDSVTIIQYQAGAMGLNLQKANKTIYFSLTPSAELFEQSKKRTHRIGQNHPCFYYYLLVKDSVDEERLEVLKRREDHNAELFR